MSLATLFGEFAADIGKKHASVGALRDIPFGETISYGDLASRIGKPSASRAVGSANGANPLPIVVPCHRVIGSDKSLTGFGGGIETKSFLLAHEQRFAPREGPENNPPTTVGAAN